MNLRGAVSPSKGIPFMLNRAQLINIHLTLAAFFFPFAVMFLVTGALYTISIKGSSDTRKETIALEAPLTGDVDALMGVATAALAKLDIAAPSGEASVRKVGPAFQLEWGGVAREVTLKQGATPQEGALEIREATAYRKLVQLHKAKGNVFAKAVSIAWAVGLALIFISGLVMAWASPKHRRLTIISSIAGVVLFALYYALG